MRRVSVLFFAMVCFGTLLTGCGNEKTTDVPFPETFEPPTSHLELMALYRSAYTDMDIDLYRNLLDADFHFFSSDLEGEPWSREDDLISTANLFSGEVITNSQGELTKAITAIDVDVLELQDAWSDVSIGLPYEDVRAGKLGRFDYRLVIHHAEGTITIEGEQLFVAVATETDGAVTWSLSNQAEALKTSEQTTWTNVKLAYR